MNLWSRLFGCVALLGLAFGAVSFAQDKVKGKEDKKETKKAGKDDAKDAKEEKVEEKLVYSQTIDGKIKRFDSGAARDIVLEIYLPDPKKIYDFNVWQAQQQRGIATSRDFGDRARRISQFQQEMAKKNANPLTRMSVKDVEVRAIDAMRVRSLYPPVEYDDKGELKRWTTRELQALKGKSRLPGYPSDFESLRAGQFVQVYLAKVEAPKGGTAKKKLDDDVDLGAFKPEAVLVLIKAEAAPR